MNAGLRAASSPGLVPDLDPALLGLDIGNPVVSVWLLLHPCTALHCTLHVLHFTYVFVFRGASLALGD
jgi:hypothetical protein